MGQIRSANRDDYQHVDRAVAVMAKEFAPGAETEPHSHPRGQLLHAVRGSMIAKTEEGAWIVPPHHALWIPPHTVHSVEMRGSVSMRTVYVRGGESETISARCKALAVSSLLREAILALLDEPVLYDEQGRGGALALLIVDELGRAAAAEFELPLPLDKRLAAMCQSLIENPSSPLDLDGWADRLGMSRRTFTRRFRLETGLSFGVWRRRLRAMYAAALSADGERPEETAVRVGYRSRNALLDMMRRQEERTRTP